MTKLVTYYEQSQPIKEYLNDMTTNKEELIEIYKSFQLPKNDERLDKIKDKNYKVLVITEDWCGDAMMNIPVLLNIADYTNMEVKVFHRDEDTNLIDQYLTKGILKQGIFTITAIGILYLLLVIVSNVIDFIATTTTNMMGEEIIYSFRFREFSSLNPFGYLFCNF